ncbi:MAG: DUF2304 domain-containing protein [Bacteroidia bacterium]
MDRIQILAILASLGFLFYIARLIVKGKLREEYAIIWIVCTIVLVIFSIWRNGLEVFSRVLGIYEAPNMVFTGAIFAIMIYLLHLSIVLSKVQDQNKKLTQELALLKERLEHQSKA